MNLGNQQAEAMRKIVDWFSGPQQVFRLFGYAGTGKSTLAKHIVEQLGLRNVAYAAYTGKAAHVLRTKGCDDASTIHSLIYIPQAQVRAHLEALQKQLDTETDADKRVSLQREIKAEERRLESPDWILRDTSKCPLTNVSLLVLDEVSMVGTGIARDLLSFGCKVLCLGDPAQLPPVDGGGYFINAEPDHLLTDIHRSALDSPVTRLATAVRNSNVDDRMYGIPGRDGDSGRINRGEIGDQEFDQVICGKNDTRWTLVRLMRRGRPDGLPVAGDRVMTLANSASIDVFNGQQFTVMGAQPAPRRSDVIRLTVADDDGRTRDLDAWASGFRDFTGEKEAKRNGRGEIAAVTFAQAITCHKSQGSQWDRVLVVDESKVFYGAAYREAAGRLGRDEAHREGHLQARRWLYTAVTRAAKQVVVTSL